MNTTDQRFEIYCDESRPELFVTAGHRSGRAIIGSLWMPADYRDTFKRDITALRAEHGVWGEFKWNKVSPSKLAFYRAVVEYFFACDELRFRAIVVDASQLDLARFHAADAELGFYKFYYQLLTHWIVPGATYTVFCDDKVNRDPKRLSVLKQVLQNSNRAAEIKTLQAVNSHQVVAVQLCDVLIGATQWRANGSPGSSPAKMALVNDVELRTGRPIRPTYQSERKFNIFNISLQGSRK
ncbi:MAG: DUF3800 domain-containing protein [Actinobacteria bacterium]|nr:DUF3800 domain-containing protein [Actinomycetota bacterium]